MSMETLQPEAGDDRYRELEAQRLEEVYLLSEEHDDMPDAEKIGIPEHVAKLAGYWYG